MLSEMNRNNHQTALKNTDMFIACLFTRKYSWLSSSETKIKQSMHLLNKERQNMDNDELSDIAYSLNKLKRNSTALQLLTSVSQQRENKLSAKIGQLTCKQLKYKKH